MMEIEQAIKILSGETSLEAVEELKYYAGYNRDKVIEQVQEAMDMGAEALRRQQWIPCSERLPEKTGNYLCTMEMTAEVEDEYKRHVMVGHFNKGEEKSFWTDDTPWKKTTAWMPLPEPYKGE